MHELQNPVHLCLSVVQFSDSGIFLNGYVTLHRKRFLPTVTDADLDNMARKVLREKHSG
ncbi:MAG: hypothetical protein V2I97_06910 [Desulfococcaceae bacterium]|jgi:hypothetical protein|nr:hypothetical protein [Desulfococcaceae bacterium]